MSVAGHHSNPSCGHSRTDCLKPICRRLVCSTRLPSSPIELAEVGVRSILLCQVSIRSVENCALFSYELVTFLRGRCAALGRGRAIATTDSVKVLIWVPYSSAYEIYLFSVSLSS
ncbi:hypothetical protein EVAR_78946_1 [Eumeta japonica]|uniref:Uncharacterized protein n=1 Tax=Eumeta variegata TaxID=151549 RepID=A0A4C1U382_EUMVA|nr:hypothetical protein EVAR_78946_1 [Eumeta japonica]